MLGRFKKGWVALACSLLMALVLGVALPALAAEDDSQPLDEAKLTKVINAPAGTDTTEDKFTFTFEKAAVQDDTIKADSEVPNITDLELHGVALSAGALHGDTFDQGVVAATFEYILGVADAEKPYPDAPTRATVSFPHAGVYTYEVSESEASVKGDYLCIKSDATYKVCIIVKNDEAGNPVPEKVTVYQKTNDEKDEINAKANPANPPIEGQAISGTEGGLPAGDNGINVPGFTFGNRYVKGGNFIIEKKVEGKYADRTKEFKYRLTIHDPQAPTGSAITYKISNGTVTNAPANNVLTEVNSEAAFCFYFTEGQDLVIEFTLKADGKFSIDGEWTSVLDHAVYNVENVEDHRAKIATGLNMGTQFTLYEQSYEEEHYAPTGYIYNYADAEYKSSSPAPTTVPASADGSLTVSAKSASDGSHVYVVNTFDDNSISLTGIFIDNLPYILMIAAPLAVFVVMFARKRRANAAA